MTVVRVLMLALLAGAVALGCDDDPAEPAVVVIADLEGEWTSTQIQFTSKANPSLFFNVHSIPGYPGLRLDIVPTEGSTTHATFTGVFPLPTDPSTEVPLSGTVTLVGSNQAQVDLDWPAPYDQAPPIEDFQAEFELQGNTLTFTRESAMFAFPGTEVEQEVSVVIVMVRG